MTKILRTLAASLLLAASASASAEVNLFRYQGLDYAAEDLPKPLQQAMYDAQLEYYQRLRAIAADAALELHVQEGGDKVRETLEAPAPSDEQLRAFYDQNKARINQPFEQIKPQLSDFLRQRDQQARRQAMLGELQGKRLYTLLLRAPTPPLMDFDTTGYPSKGGDKAAVTVVEFADFQCPHCQRAASVLKQVEKEYGDRVRFVYLDFPVNPSGVSREVSLGGVCAQEQDRFWAYHDAAFAQQRTLSKQSPRQLAKTLELEMEAFDDCLASERPKARIDAAMAQGERAGVRATPTLFVNGRRLEAEQLGRDLRNALDKALAADS